MMRTIYRTKILLKKKEKLLEDRKDEFKTELTIELYKKSIIDEYKEKGLDVNVDVTYK